MMRMRGIWTLLLALALAQPAQAQETWTFQTNRGWVGITISYASAVLSGGSEETVVVINDVVEGSPAEAAGIQVGDTLTHLDGQPISEEVMTSLQRTLEIGDLVRMTILRGDRSREVLVEAGPQRPNSWTTVPDAEQMVLHLDSVRGAILENLDSLRVTISGVGMVGFDPSGQVSIRILDADSLKADEGGFFDINYRIREPWVVDTLHLGGTLWTKDSPGERARYFISSPDPAVPFGAFVVSSKESEPLREDLRRIRKGLTEIRRHELSRIRELQAGVQGPVEELLRQDARIQELQMEEQALLQEQREVTQNLQRISEETMQRRFSEIQSRQEEALSAAVRAAERNSSRSRAEMTEAYRAQERALFEEYESRSPSTHILVGQNFVAGAQLKPLNPDLAEYFGVDQGVLVTEVLDETPAHQAGMLAGDVIVRVGTEDVSSMDDLRFGVGFFERPLRLRIIRKGSPVEIVIRR